MLRLLPVRHWSATLAASKRGWGDAVCKIDGASSIVGPSGPLGY